MSTLVLNENEITTLEFFHPKIRDGQLARGITNNSYYGMIVCKVDDCIVDIKTNKPLCLTKDLLMTQFELLNFKEIL